MNLRSFGSQILLRTTGLKPTWWTQLSILFRGSLPNSHTSYRSSLLIRAESEWNTAAVPDSPGPPLPPPLHVPRKISHCGRGTVNPWHKSCFLQFQTFTHTYTVRHTSKYGTSFSEWPRAPLSCCQGHLLHSSVANISYAAAVERVLAISLTSQCDQWGGTSRAWFPKPALYAECGWTPISQGLACLHKARI